MEAISAINVRTLSGGLFSLQQNLLDSFKMKLIGPLFLPGTTGYEESRTLWNAMVDKKPALVVRCQGVADVIKCVRFAREHDLLLCIKGGGHNIAGLAVADEALMIDLSLMRGVWVEPKEKVAHAQAGCLIVDVDNETQLHGLATVLGHVSQTGITGLTLGGGFGYLTRRWGWTADNVIGMDVVTADGKLVHASSEENSDLFWALLGGGGNYGIVTGIDYKLYPVGPMVVGGFIAWPASEASKVTELFRSITETAPIELTLMLIMRRAPAVPWLPADRHGTPIIMIGACYSGDLEAGEKIVAPIKSFGNPIGDVIVRRPYAQLQRLLDAGNPKGRRYYSKNEYLKAIDPSFAEKFIHNAGRIQSPFSAAILFQLNGVLNNGNGNGNHVSAGNRDAHYMFNLISSWERADGDEANIEWARQGWYDLKQFSTGGTYINFLSMDEGADRTRAALGEEYERLARVKLKWDPENIFRTNRNIPPAK